MPGAREVEFMQEYLKVAAVNKYYDHTPSGLAESGQYAEGTLQWNDMQEPTIPAGKSSRC